MPPEPTRGQTLPALPILCPGVKLSCPPVQNLNEPPAIKTYAERLQPTTGLTCNFSGFKVYERVGISTTSFPGFSPTHHYGVRELKERPWLGLVMWLQNKINSEGGVLCLSIFLFHSRNDHKGPR